MQLALFDFDNTITNCDGYARFLRRIATAEQLAQAKWKMGPWLLAYRLKLLSAQGIRARVTQFAFTGRAPADIIAQGTRYAIDALPATLRPDMMQRIAWHQAQGHRIVVVSGSLDLYLQPWCEAHGLDLICNSLEQHDGRLTGRYAGADIGADKVRHIRARYDLDQYDRIHAYGDSREDLAMLALAHERWYRGKQIT